MGLCKFCKYWCKQCGVYPAHCSNAASESHVGCNVASGYLPFTPVEGLAYSRDYILDKWMTYVNKKMAEAGA